MISESITFPSLNSNVHKAEEFCRSFLTPYIKDTDLLDNILIVLTELVNNAIIHGNKMDASKKVTIKFFLDETKYLLKCQVIDEGKGFDEKKLGDPTDNSNLMKTSGRGIYIVKHFASEFRHYIKNNQHVVEVIFNYS